MSAPGRVYQGSPYGAPTLHADDCICRPCHELHDPVKDQHWCALCAEVIDRETRLGAYCRQHKAIDCDRHEDN